MKLREIKCPKCTDHVRIPLFWSIGIEGIFYCRNCRKSFKINYRVGAMLSGAGFAFSFATVQYISLFASAFTVIVSVLIFIPLGVFYSFLLRRTVLLLKIRRNNQ